VESKLGPLGTSATEWPIVPAQVIVMMENLVEWRLAGETEVLGENLPQRHFFHHKSYLPDPGSNLDRRGGIEYTKFVKEFLLENIILIIITTIMCNMFTEKLTRPGTQVYEHDSSWAKLHFIVWLHKYNTRFIMLEVYAVGDEAL
jgi:hypothetical protein